MGPRREHCPVSILILDISPLQIMEDPDLLFPARRTIIAVTGGKHSRVPQPASHFPDTAPTSNTAAWYQPLGHDTSEDSTVPTCLLPSLCGDISCTAQAAPNHTRSAWKVLCHTFYHITLPPPGSFSLLFISKMFY